MDWTQCTRPERVVKFMTKPAMKELVEKLEAAGNHVSHRMKWYKPVHELRTELANVLNAVEYGIEEDESVGQSARDDVMPENRYLVEKRQ